MKDKCVEYEVFADSVYGSDIMKFDTLEKAQKEAEKWSNETDCDVYITKVETTIVEYFTKGEKHDLHN